MRVFRCKDTHFLRIAWLIRVFCGISIHFFAVFYSVFFLQYLFGAAGARKFSDILIFIWAAAVIDVLISIYNAWFYESYMYREYIKIGYRLNLKLFKKAQTADISCYETPEFYNIYTKAASEAAARAMSVLNNCSAAVSALISSVTVIVTMAKITPLALIFIALPLIGNLFFGKKLGHVTFEIDRDSTPARRQKDYVNRVLYFRKYAAEIRTTGFFGVLKEAYGLAAKRTVEVARQYALKKSLYSGAKSILMFLLGYEGMWLCAAILGISGKLGVSELIVLLNAIVSVSWMLNNFERSVSVTFSAVQKGEATIIRLDGEKLGALIGRRGETMESLSYLASLVANRLEGDYIKLGLDVAGYRDKRESDLTALAQRIGAKVRKTGRSFAMEPMNPYERRIIHSAISKMEGVRSESKGEGRDRRVVIYSTAPDAQTENTYGERRGRGGNRNGRRPGGNRSGGYRGERRSNGGYRGSRSGAPRGPRPSGVPERTYAPRDAESAAPVAPKRTERVDDFADFSFGKIEL